MTLEKKGFLFFAFFFFNSKNIQFVSWLLGNTARIKPL